MALQKQSIPLPLARGIDKSTADQLRSPESLSEGLNIEQRKTGELSKRNGFDAKVTTSAQGASFVPLRQGVGFFDAEGDLYSLNSDEDAQNKIYDQNTRDYNFRNYDIKRLPFFSELESSLSSAIHIYNDTIYLFVRLIVKNESRLYRMDKNLHIIPYGSFEYYYLGSNTVSFGRFIDNYLLVITNVNQINVWNIETVLTVGTNITAAAVAGFEWDVCKGASGDYFIGYHDSAANSTYYIDKFNSSWTRTGAISSAGTGEINSLCMIGQAFQSTFCIAVGRGSAATNITEVTRYNESLSAQATLTETRTSDRERVTCITGIAHSTHGLTLFIQFQLTSVNAFYASNPEFFRRVNVSNSFTTGAINYSTAAKRDSLQIETKPFYGSNAEESDDLHILARFEEQGSTTSIAQNSLYMCNGTSTTSKIIGAGASSISPTIGADVAKMSDGTIYCLASVKNLVIDDNPKRSLELIKIKRQSEYIGSKPVQIGDKSYIAHSGLFSIEGGRLFNYGFEQYPEELELSTSGGFIPAGTYSYVAVYRRYDIDGNLIESAPSRPRTITTGGVFSIVVKIRPSINTFTNYSEVQFYRTTNGGTTYYFVGTASLGTNTISYVDGTLDNLLVDNRILYTTGGVAENITPGNTNFLAVAKNRLWTFENGSRNTLWFTKKPRESFVPGFSDLQTLQIAEAGGELVAVAQLDDKILAFKQKAVFVIFGDGPNDILQGSFSEPNSIVQGMGCISARSVQETPIGVFYQSDEGIYLIDRSLSNVFIGQPIYKEDAIVKSSQYDAVLNRVFFLTSSSIWVYYLTTQSWYEWTVPNPVDLLVKENAIYLLSTTKLLKQGAGWQDDSSNYEQKMKLGQFQFAGIQGYQRLYRILLTGKDNGDEDSSNVTVKTYIDNNSAATDTNTIALNTLQTGNRTEIEIRPSKQRCESMEVELSVTANNSGLTLNSATAEVGGYAGSGRRSESRRV